MTTMASAKTTISAVVCVQMLDTAVLARPLRTSVKPVTILFVDLKDSTELATQHDPEHLRALLAAFLDEMRSQIEALGGAVEKFASDAVMAVFGVPPVNEDDGERAVRAAFAMQENLARLTPMFDQEYGAQGRTSSFGSGSRRLLG
jgi:class 3 adenylate cyclase